jgi:hypothetical protein
MPLIDLVAARNPKAVADKLAELIPRVVTAVSLLTRFGSLFQSRRVFFPFNFRFGWLTLSHHHVQELTVRLWELHAIPVRFSLPRAVLASS